MRKLFIVATAGLLLACAKPSPPPPFLGQIIDWQQREANCQSTEELAEGLTTRADIVKALLPVLYALPAVTYQAEETDRWQTSCEVAESLRGDCEDIAAYDYRAIREARIVSDHRLFIRIVAQSATMGHAFVVIQADDGELRIEGRYVRYGMPEEWRIQAEYDLWEAYY